MDPFEKNLREALRAPKPAADLTEKVMSRVALSRRSSRPSGQRWLFVSAAAVVVVAFLSLAALHQKALYATVETSDGAHYRAKFEEPIYSEGGSLVSLPDGSRIEMRSRSTAAVETVADGLQIALKNGSIIVNAAKQRNGRLYVRTRDVVVSVVGTVFLVNAEDAGSRVAVIEGEVHVQEGKISKELLPGQQVATAPTMAVRSLPEEIAWSRHAAEHIALLKHTATTAVDEPVASAGETPLIFEVVSIKPSEARTSVMGGCRGKDGIYVVNSISPEPPLGRCVFYNGTVKHLVSFAYSPWPAPLPLTMAISGGPDWLTKDRFNVEAKSPDASVREPELQQMLQNMLAERFKLVVHYDVQSVSGFALVVSKAGPRLRPAGADESESISGIPAKITPPSVAAPIDRTITITAQHYPLSKLAGILSRLGPGPVEDKTNLTSAYDFTLTWNEAAGPTLFTALKEQLGLQFESQKVQVKTLVIDHAEKPLEN